MVKHHTMDNFHGMLQYFWVRWDSFTTTTNNLELIKYYLQNNEVSFSCGGSIISSFYVLTASHCVTYLSTSQTIDPDNLIIYAGKNSLKKSCPHERKFSVSFIFWWNLKCFTNVFPRAFLQVSKVISHPNYDHESFKFDIAMVKLSTQIQFNDYIRPICLWNKNYNIRRLVNTLGSVSLYYDIILLNLISSKNNYSKLITSIIIHHLNDFKNIF